MGRIVDLRGIKVGKLTVLEPTEERVHKSVVWKCLCECGNHRLVQSSWIQNIAKGRVGPCENLSCGCSIPGHGMSDTPTYVSWRKMLARVRHKEYIHHFGIVSVCPEWDTYQGGSFENFYRDMGERPEGTSINRINGAPTYSKETCEWADATLQIYDQCRRSDNSSGKTGVQASWKGKWLASIKKAGRKETLYYGDSLEEAIAAREKAELEWYGFLTKTEQTHVKSPE